MLSKKTIWTGVITISIVVLYWVLGFWYYSYGDRPDYLEFTLDGTEIEPILKDKYSFNGNEYEEYSQTMVLHGYLQRIYPDFVCGNAHLLAVYKSLRFCFAPMNQTIRWIKNDPPIITDEYTVIDGSRLLKK
jgi:hypothetical protein